jgi:cyclohexadienyl dehydratase
MKPAVLACLAVAMLAGGCRSTPPAPQADLDRIIATGTVRVCSTGDYRPFTYHDADGRWSGLDIDLANNLAKHLGVALQLIPTTWPNLMTDLGQRCDFAMGGITITLNRAKTALFSNPYLRDGKAAAVRCTDARQFTSLADIDRPGVRVVVNPGGTNAEFDRANLHHANVIEYRDNNTIFEQLANNSADVMITDASEIRWHTVENSQLCGVSVDHPFTFSQKAYLFPRSGDTTLQWVNQWLNLITNDGTFAALSQKWLG